jgi:hypothetical protein
MLNKQNLSDSEYLSRCEQCRKFLQKLLEGVQNFRSAPLLEALAAVLLYHGCPLICVESFLSSAVLQLCANALEGLAEADAVKREKFLTVYPFARIMRFRRTDGTRCEDLPSGDPFRFKNPFKNWYKQRTNACNEANIHLWYSFLQAKRAAAPLTEDIVWDKYLDHRQALERRDPLSPFAAERLIDSSPFFVQELDRAAAEVDWSRIRASLTHELSAPAPSPSAAFCAKRAIGGQSGAIRRILQGRTAEEVWERFIDPAVEGSGFERETSLLRSLATETIRVTYRPIRAVNNSLAYNSLIWEFGSEVPFDTFRECLKLSGFHSSVYPLTYEIRRVLWVLREYHPHLYARCRAPLVADIKCVLEPLKCRIISCGSAPHYYACKRIQEELWSGLQGNNSFRLTSGPVTVEDIEWITRCPKRCHVNGDDMGYRVAGEYVSVDYEAATDNSSQNLGAAILRRLLRNCPDDLNWLTDVAMKVFGLHDLFYQQCYETDSYPGDGPDAAKQNVDSALAQREARHDAWFSVDRRTGREAGKAASKSPLLYNVSGERGSYCIVVQTGKEKKYSVLRYMSGKQQNGQLMGSILSFPILCWINYLTFLLLQSTMSSGKPPSGGSWTGATAFAEHTRIAALVGLKMSRGKAYVHPNFVNLNSTCFYKRGNGYVKEIPYLNYALVLNKHKVQSDERKPIEDREEDEIRRLSVSHWNKVQNGLYRGRLERAIWKEFKRNHLEALEHLSEGWRSYHLSPCYGGLGLSFGWECETTPLQRAALRIRRTSARAEGFWLDQRPARGPDVRSELARRDGGCYVRDVKRVMDEPHVDVLSKTDERNHVRRLLSRNPRLGRPIRPDQTVDAVTCWSTPLSVAHGVAEYNWSKTVLDQLNSSVPTKKRAIPEWIQTLRMPEWTENHAKERSELRRMLVLQSCKRKETSATLNQQAYSASSLPSPQEQVEEGEYFKDRYWHSGPYQETDTPCAQLDDSADDYEQGLQHFMEFDSTLDDRDRSW